MEKLKKRKNGKKEEKIEKKGKQMEKMRNKMKLSIAMCKFSTFHQL